MSEGRPLTGRKVLLITFAFFGVIIAVNFVLAFKAISTFPGLEVENSYVASQQFDALRKAQIGLGWRLGIDYRDGELVLGFVDASGRPVKPAKLEVVVGRATERKDDVEPEFDYIDGSFRAPLDLVPGIWEIRLRAHSDDGTLFRQTRELFVKG